MQDTDCGPEQITGRDEMEPLIQGIALSQRFHFYLLFSRTPAANKLALQRLYVEVGAQRGQPPKLVRLDPYDGLDEPPQPIPAERLGRLVLEPLAWAKEAHGPEVVVLVDGSLAMPGDDEAWVWLFQRLNEQRNVVAEQLGCPLVLCLPSRLETLFAHAAPDFWSIRSNIAEVKTVVNEPD